MVGLFASGAVLSYQQAGVHWFAGRLPLYLSTAVESTMAGLTERIGGLTLDKVLLSRTLGWAATNWALDATSLWCCLRAYGFSAPVGPLLAVYGAASLLALLPVTPAGLGVVEGVLIPAEDQHAASAWGSQYCLVERVDIGDRNGGGQAPRGNPRGPCPYT